MKFLLTHPLLILTILVSPAKSEAGNESPAEFQRLAREAKANDDMPGYIHKMNRAGWAASDWLAAGKLSFPEAARFLVEGIELPDYNRPPLGWSDDIIGPRARLMEKLTSMPIQDSVRTDPGFFTSRRSLASACIRYFDVVRKASLAAEIEKAEANIKKAEEALKKVPPEAKIQSRPTSLASGLSFANVEDPRLRTALERHRDAFVELRIAKAARENAIELLPELTRCTAAVLRRLYSQPFDETEVTEFLRENMLEDSELARAYHAKQ